MVPHRGNGCPHPMPGQFAGQIVDKYIRAIGEPTAAGLKS